MIRTLLVAALTAAPLTGCGAGAAAPVACPADTPTFSTGQDTVEVWFCSGDTALAANLYRPADPVGSVVFVHGSGEVPRLAAGNPVVTGLLDASIAVLTYDKRGVGDSRGQCCPGDDGQFTDLIADATAAVHALQQARGLGQLPIGIYGESQAAWIAPATARQAPVAFLILTSAPTVSVGEELLHEELTDQGLDQAEIDERLRTTQATGADPRADIADLIVPMLWIYGSADTVIPVGYSIDVLTDLAAAHDLNVTVETLDGAGHSLIHHPDLFPVVGSWLQRELPSQH